jgi:hypothetical protein
LAKFETDSEALLYGKDAFKSDEFEKAFFSFKEARWLAKDNDQLKKIDHWIELAREKAGHEMMRKAHHSMSEENFPAVEKCLQRFKELEPEGDLAGEGALVAGELLEIYEQEVSARKRRKYIMIGAPLFVGALLVFLMYSGS